MLGEIVPKNVIIATTPCCDVHRTGAKKYNEISQGLSGLI